MCAYCGFGGMRYVREAMALLSPTMALYPGSASIHLIRAHMELKRQSK
jgi:hypothetical protein